MDQEEGEQKPIPVLPVLGYQSDPARSSFFTSCSLLALELFTIVINLVAAFLLLRFGLCFLSGHLDDALHEWAYLGLAIAAPLVSVYLRRLAQKIR